MMTSNKKDLAIIGANYLQLPLIEKAKEMGYKTHVFAWAANDVGETAADYFYPISITEVEEITNKCRDIGICGICTIATDLGNYTVNYVADKLGLPGNSMDCTRKSTNKYLMREAFKYNGDPSPKSIRVNKSTDLSELEIGYPVIVKPTDRSGSRGITKLDSATGLEKAVADAINDGFDGNALIEEYVNGKEYSVEGISYQGIHHILAMTEKSTTGAPHFIETGHMEPAEVSEELYRRVVDVVTHALDTLEIKNSASHSEIKIDENGEIKIIEIGSRMGGDCIGSDLVYLSTGIDYIKTVLQVACGEKPDLQSSGECKKVQVKYILSEDDAEEFRTICMNEPERIIKVVEPVRKELLGKTTNSSDRAGCYILRLN